MAIETLILNNYGIKTIKKSVLQNTLNSIYKISGSDNKKYILRVIPKSTYKTVQSFINEYLVLEKLIINEFNTNYFPIKKTEKSDDTNLFEKYVTENIDGYISLFNFIDNTTTIKNGEMTNVIETVKYNYRLHQLMRKLNNLIVNTDLYSKKYLEALFSNSNDYFNFVGYYKDYKSVIDNFGLNKLLLLDNYVNKLKNTFNNLKIYDFTEQPIHGDLRPENYLFNKNGSINSIIDFEGVRNDLLLAEFAWTAITFSQKYYKFDSTINLDLLNSFINEYKNTYLYINEKEFSYIYHFIIAVNLRSCESVLYLNRNNINSFAQKSLNFNINTIENISKLL